MSVPADDRERTEPLEQASALIELRVDFIDASVLADEAPGRLGLTFMPGKHGASDRYPGLIYERDLDADLAALRRQGITYLLLLVDDTELDRWGDPRIVERAAEMGLTVERHPLADGSPPATASDMANLLVRLRDARARGDVAVACMGGVGRTGTVAACALVEAGISPDDAIAQVRRVRHPGAVETRAQRDFVNSYARWLVGERRA
jgi:protein-tyrosine phosphatase